MTFESRAHGAVLDINRAVEVMEMTTSTKEPQRIERFDQFRDRKQRNRRIGALVVAGALVIFAIAAIAVNMAENDEGAIVPAGTAPLDGRILYETYSGGYTSELFTVGAAGGESQDLGLHIDPSSAWSPDGTRILVSSTAGPAETATPVRPATVAPDGSDFRLLDGVEDPSLNIACTTFSPDGSRLACTGYDNEGVVHGMYTVRASDGGGLHQLTDAEGTPAAYSPNGERLLFVRGSFGENGDLHVVGIDGTGLRDLTQPNSMYPDTGATWSPDGRWITFVDADGAVQAVHPDGTGLHPISMPPEASIDEALSAPAWSPNGGWIAFSARANGADHPDIYLVQVSGADLDGITDYRQLTDTPDVSEFNPDWTS